MKPNKTIVYFYRGGTERPDGRSYRWHDGYSAMSANGNTLYPWMTKAECRSNARAQGARAEFNVPAGRIATDA